MAKGKAGSYLEVVNCSTTLLIGDKRTGNELTIKLNLKAQNV
jgi:hypothetical protein